MISMKDYGPDTYGERIAEVYDERYLDARPEQVELLAELAGAGPVLELGIGTGRLVRFDPHGVPGVGAREAAGRLVHVRAPDVS